MRKIRLVTYGPLCIGKLGLEAIEKYNILPFVDSSCRREPDLENPYPSITALCRKNKLAPQLRPQDLVVYLTKPGKIKASEKYLLRGEYKLTAILEVQEIFSTHQMAAEWYKSKGVALPSNCMVEDNPPNQFDRTVGSFNSAKEMKQFESFDEEKKIRRGEAIIRAWDRGYQQRADEYNNFVITKPLFLDIYNPLSISRELLIKWFGKVPGTQTPKLLTPQEFAYFEDHISNNYYKYSA